MHRTLRPMHYAHISPPPAADDDDTPYFHLFSVVKTANTNDCVTFCSLHHYASFNAPVDDLRTWMGKWVAAAGKGRTVNRDWSNKHRGGFSLMVLVVMYQAIL